MKITREIVAQKLAAHLRHELSRDELVDWAEDALMDAELDASDVPVLRDSLARLGVADVRAFGLRWEDCESILKKLGYAAHLQIEAL